MACLLSMGYSHKKIGAYLGISPKNVSMHVSKIAARIPGHGGSSLKVAVWFLEHRA